MAPSIRPYGPLAILTVLAAAPATLAQQPQQQPAGPGVALTIYSTAQPGAVPPELYRPALGEAGRPRPLEVPGYAVVRQQRTIDLQAGINVIRFSDVAAKIDPTTVSFSSLTDPAGTTVLEQNYEFDLVSPDKLLAKYLDRPIALVRDLGNGKTEQLTGTLLSADYAYLVLQTDDPNNPIQIVSRTQQMRTIALSALPGGLITKPTLVWQLHAEKPGSHLVRVAYQTAAITWWADYNLVFAEGKDANSGLLDVSAWVSIINQSGASYPDARLKLIAGEVHRAPTPGIVEGRERVFAARAKAEAFAFEEKPFFEYHMYTLGRTTTLPDNSAKQIELFTPATGVPCEKVLVYYGLPMAAQWSFVAEPMLDRNLGTECNKKVDIYLKFKNDKASGLGIPLPAGRIRVNKLDPADGSLEFIGEDVLDHTPKDEQLLIKLGSAFDVVGERKQTDFRLDTRAHVAEESFEITVRNHKSEPINVIVKENLYRWLTWEITQSSHKYEKIDARTIHFPITMKADGTVTLTYTVRYRW
jgi:hypothetical protein